MSKPARPGGVCSFCDLESSSCFQSLAHLRPFYAAVLGRAKARCRIRRCPAGSGLPFAPRGSTCVHRRRHVAMAQQPLNHANVLAALEQMRGKSVPVAHDTLCGAPLSPALRVGALSGPLVKIRRSPPGSTTEPNPRRGSSPAWSLDPVVLSDRPRGTQDALIPRQR
jgi:hypothetical protein